MAARRERGLFDPDAAPGTSPFDHFVYVFASDGDIEEGITHEVSSLAGHQRARQPDRPVRRQPDLHRGRHEHRQVRGRRRPVRGLRLARAARRLGHRRRRTTRTSQALYDAFQAAKEHTEAPSFIVLRTIIGWPAPNKQNTGAAHGSALGEAEVAATKEILQLRPGGQVPRRGRGAEPRPAGRRARQGAARRVGGVLRAVGEGEPGAQGPVRPARRSGSCPRAGRTRCPSSRPTPRAPAPAAPPARSSPRSRPVLPELWGGSADLAESNNTTMEGEPSFIPADHQTEDVAAATRTGGRCTSASASTAWARS